MTKNVNVMTFIINHDPSRKRPRPEPSEFQKVQAEKRRMIEDALDRKALREELREVWE